MKKFFSGIIFTLTFFMHADPSDWGPNRDNSATQASLIKHNEELSDKDFKAEVFDILHSLCSQIAIILPRIDAIQNSDIEIKQHNTKELVALHERLITMRDSFDTIVNNREKTLQLLITLNTIANTLDEALRDTFQKPLSFSKDTTITRKKLPPLKRAQKYATQLVTESAQKLSAIKAGVLHFVFNTVPHLVLPEKDEPIFNKSAQEAIEITRKKLAHSEELIANLGKTPLNKMYSAFTHWWNSPLFSIAPLGNYPIYPGTIVKKALLYGGNTLLIIYNVNDKVVQNIPIKCLRETILKIKGFLGKKTTMAETTSYNTKDLPISGGNFCIDNGQKIESWVVLKLDDNGLPLIKQETRTVDGQTSTYWIAETESGFPIETPHLETLLNQVKYVGKIYDKEIKKDKTSTHTYIGEAKYVEKNEEGTGVNVKSLGHYIIPDAETSFMLNSPTLLRVPDSSVPEILKLPLAKPQVVVNSTYDANGNPVDSRLILGGKGMGEGGIQKLLVPLSGNGFIDSCMSSVSWFVNVDLETKLTVSAGSILAKAITDDFKWLLTQRHNIAGWVHAKLSGTIASLEAYFSTSKITFDDVVGRKAIKEKLQKYITFVENPKLAIQAGITVPRGIIMAGPPQTGKTMMAQAFLGELTKAVKTHGSGRLFRMITVKVHDIVKTGLGIYLEWMKQFAPCIVFCDEFELTGAQRNENRELLAEFLTALSGFDTSEDIDKMVFFLVATNHPENIDRALQEPGRMGTHIYFELPTASEREEFFMHTFKKHHINTANINLTELVQETAACSYGALKDLISDILRRAETSKDTVSQVHINQTLDAMVRRIVLDEYPMPDDKRLALAARYSAQAFSSIILNPHKKFIAATIYKITPDFKKDNKNDPVGKNVSFLQRNYGDNKNGVTGATVTDMTYGGFFSYDAAETFGLVPNSEKLKQCKIAIAGTVGQKILGLDYITFPGDIFLAHQYAREIVFDGFQEELLPKDLVNQKRKEAYDLVKACEKEIEELLLKHKDHYKKIVDLLQRRYLIRIDDIKQLFGLTSLDLDTFFNAIPVSQESSTAFDKELALILGHNQADATAAA